MRKKRQQRSVEIQDGIVILSRVVQMIEEGCGRVEERDECIDIECGDVSVAAEGVLVEPPWWERVRLRRPVRCYYRKRKWIFKFPIIVSASSGCDKFARNEVFAQLYTTGRVKSGIGNQIQPFSQDTNIYFE